MYLHPQQAGPKIPPSLNVHRKVAFSSLCILKSVLWSPISSQIKLQDYCLCTCTSTAVSVSCVRYLLNMSVFFILSWWYTRAGTSMFCSKRECGVCAVLKINRNTLKPNSWTYNIVEVSGHNLDSSQTWGFCMDFLNHREGSMVSGFHPFSFTVYSNRTVEIVRGCVSLKK
jgi:hypothetical protein